MLDNLLHYFTTINALSSFFGYIEFYNLVSLGS